MTDHCDRCNRYFSSRSAYNQHIRYSSNHWKCQHGHPEADFKSLRALKEHYVQSPHHPCCQYCNVHFNSPLVLQDHYEEYHAYCSSCNKVFKNDFGLHEHNRQKPEHADLYCIACRKLFQTPNGLRSHKLNSRKYQT
ncbi:hypothetical protein BDR03DRAFT_961879 [Suillus americanus]|nr:hypothetical protein BDR03DRAFT_961879 [Suillus americanus]